MTTVSSYIAEFNSLRLTQNFWGSLNSLNNNNHYDGSNISRIEEDQGYGTLEPPRRVQYDYGHLIHLNVRVCMDDHTACWACFKNLFLRSEG